ncbi:peptide/nickel transport system substrate-binding protein [Catenulispora sp. MAP5-51]|uniref:ABC transporter substrate-binding protein n=1 Tax=Catenulispora sp. MAP5-51 TaxID=3156298 RepID=UPI003518C186
MSQTSWTSRGPGHTGPPGRGLRLGAVLAALTFCAATACASASSSSSASAKPVSGGTLVYASDQLPDCLDPAVSPKDVVGVIDRGIVDSLVSEAPDGTLHPWLATSWTVSPSGTEYTFKLRSGVTFQDGTPFDASAVKATLDHVLARATASQYAASLLGPFTGASVVDPGTVRITLSAPFAPLLQALSTPYLGIQSPAALKGSQSQLCAHPVGSGPFSFVSWTKPTSLVLKNNPHYAWAPPDAPHQGAAYLDGVTFQFNTTDASRFGSLTSGQSDLVEDVPPVDVKTLKAQPSLKLLSGQQPGAVYTIGLNTAKGPLADQRVREALQRSIDLDQLVNSLYFGQYARAWSMLSPTTPDYDASLEKSWPYDPALAGQLLDQAGWTGRDASGYRTKDGATLALRWPVTGARQDRSALAQGIQAEAKQAGIRIDYVNEDSGTYLKDLISANLDLVDSSFMRDEPDILRHFYASGQTTRKGGANEFGLSVPQLDQWLEGGAASGDPAVRKQDYAQAQQYIINQALAIPVYVPTALLGYRTAVHGLTLSADKTPEFYGVWKSR